ncbi:MAG: hypothetical protein KC445_11175 [Anaerolineales bacterium]|nr:hypothetical protein [Anaerolineales bacterium]
MVNRLSYTAVFLLRCWVEPDSSSEVPTWRFRLENPHTGEAHSFTSLTALNTFLATHLDQITHNFKETQ